MSMSKLAALLATTPTDSKAIQTEAAEQPPVPAASPKVGLAALLAAQKEEASQEILSPEAKAAKAEEEPLGKVIQAFNATNSVGQAGQVLEGELLGGQIEGKEGVRQIQDIIMGLSLVEGEDLRQEVQKLKTMLLQNPSACHFLVDEDLGLAVRAFRRMTNNRVAKDLGAAKPRGGKAAKAKDIYTAELTAESLAAGLADL